MLTLSNRLPYYHYRCSLFSCLASSGLNEKSSGPKLFFNVLADQIVVEWINQSAEGNFSGNTKSVMERECERLRLGFIDNSNIDPESHLNGSGLHLNMEGTIILANNFIRAMGY